jgi:hypothetical protein
MPDAHRDPNSPDQYIITWQRYAYRPAGCQVMDPKFSVYDASTRVFSPEEYVFDPCEVRIQQAHPCWGYSHGQYRVFYCQESGEGDFIAEVTAERWSDLQEYAVSNNEPVVTPDVRSHPHMVFLSVDSSTAWLFYTTRPGCPPRFAYSVFDEDEGWDRSHHLIPADELIGPTGEGNDLGSAMIEGSDIVLYSVVDNGDDRGDAYRFRTADRGKTWTAAQLSVTGIEDPFKKRALFTRVVKKGDTYYLSSQSRASHRWLARSDDGVRFDLVADFGEGPSLGNEMVSIEGTDEILLIYASWPDPPRREEEGHIECLVYDTEKGQ